MQIKDLFSKLIRDPSTRKDAEDLITGKVKVLFEEAIDDKGKPYERLTPVGAVSKEDIASFRKFNSTNIRKNVADSLYKFYKQKQKDLYKSYVTQIRKSINFYDSELNKIYGEGFSEQFASLKEKEDAFSKMKFMSLQSSGIGKTQLAEVGKIKASPDYEKNKKKYEERVKTLMEQYHMLKRSEFAAKKGSVPKHDIEKNFSNYREENNTTISLIEQMNDKNQDLVYSMVEDSVGRLHELNSMIERSTISQQSKDSFSKKIEESKTKLSDSANNMDFVAIIEEVSSSIGFMESLMEEVNNKKKELKEYSNKDIKRLRGNLEKGRAAGKVKTAMDMKMLSGEEVDKKEYEKVSKIVKKINISDIQKQISDMEFKQKEVSESTIKAYDVMLERVHELYDNFSGRKIDSKEVKTDIRGEVEKKDISVSQVYEGNLSEISKITQSQIDLIMQISEENDKLKNIETNLEESNKIPEIEAQLNDINLRTGKIEGTVTSPSEYIEQMAKEFGSYMLRIRMVQRGIQDITDAIGEFQKIDDEAFQLGMVSDMNVGSIKRYRNEVLGLAADYRTTAEEIVNAQSEVIKSGRTFDQAKQQVSASLILARSTFEDLASASEVMNKVLLTLEMNGSRSYETMSRLYNVVQNTPASIAGMEASMRQSASAFSGLLDEIDYSGSQLDKYKDQLRDAEFALTGFINLQGKTPQMAGTAVKTLVDKMRSPTDKAITQVNMDLSKSGATYEGENVTSAMLSRLVETDFNKGIDLLSKLYVNGNLTYKAIQDMFGPRNAATISKLLYQVNGDLIASSGDMLTKLDPLKDSEKLSQSWSQEMEELKNSFRALKGIANDFGDALLPLIDITGEAIQGVAKLANENVAVKSGIQVGSAAFSAGKIGKELLLSTYAMHQGTTSKDKTGLADEYKDFAMIGNIFKDLTKDGRSLGQGLSIAFDAVGKSAKSLGKALISGPGLATAGILVGITLLTTALKYYNEQVSKTEQNAKDTIKAFSSREESIKSFDSSAQSMSEVFNSLEPISFKTASSISLLSDEIKNMLDMTIDYTGKLSALTKQSIYTPMAKALEQEIANSTSEEQKRKARTKLKVVEKYEKGEVPDEKTLESYKKRALVREKLGSNPFDSTFIGSFKNATWTEDAEKQRVEDEKNYLIEMSKALGMDYKELEDAFKKGMSFKENSSVLTGELKDKRINELLSSLRVGEVNVDGYTVDLVDKNFEEWKAYAEVSSETSDAKSKYIESVQSTIAKETSMLQSINNSISNSIKENQSSIFSSQGDILSTEQRLSYMLKDKTLADLLSGKEGTDIEKKISTVNNKTAMRYLEGLSTIKKNKELIDSSLSQFSEYGAGRKNKFGTSTIGSARNTSKIMESLLDVKTEDNRSFEDVTGLNLKEIRKISKTSNSSNLLSKIKEQLVKNEKDIDKIMTEDFKEKIISVQKNNKNILETSMEKVYVMSDFGIEDMNDLVGITKSLKGTMKDNIEVQKDILINTTSEAVYELVFRTLIENGHQVSEELQARKARISKPDIKILESLNESQRSMDALMMQYSLKISQISANLASASAKVSSMGVTGFIGNKTDERRNKINQLKESTVKDFAEAGQIVGLNETDEANVREKWIRENLKKDKKLQSILLKKESERSQEESDFAKISGGMAEGAISGKIASENEKRIKSIAESLYNSIYNSVNESGAIDESSLKKILDKAGTSQGTKINEIAKNISDFKKSLYDELSISPEEKRRTVQKIRQNTKDYAISKDFGGLEGMSGAGGSGTSLFKTISTTTSKINTAMEDSYLKLVDSNKKYTKDAFNNIIDSFNQGTDIENIFNSKEFKGLDSVSQSALKDYLENSSQARIDEINATNELVEQMRLFKNELVKDIHETNRITGKGEAYDSNLDLNKYFSNQEDISTKYAYIEKLIGNKSYSYEKDAKGNLSIKGEGLDTVAINKFLKEISDRQRENAKIEENLDAYTKTLVQSQKEFGFQTSDRNLNRAANSAQSRTGEGIFQTNESLFETRIGKANAWLNVYNDILSSASSIPSIQKEISKNQIEILKNMENELKAKYKSTGNIADLAEAEKVRIQYLMQEIEARKVGLQLEIERNENQKRMNAIMAERKEITGQLNTPDKILEESMKVAYDQMMLSLEQMNIEEQINNNMKLTVKSMESLKTSVDDLAKATVESAPGYIKPKESSSKIVELSEKGKTYESGTSSQELIQDSIKKRLIVEQYINDIYKARAEYVKNIDSKFGGTIDNIESLITGSFDKIKTEVPSLSKSLTSLYGNYSVWRKGADEKKSFGTSMGISKMYAGDISAITKSSLGEFLPKDFEEKNKNQLEMISMYNKASSEDKGRLLDAFGMTEEELYSIKDIKKASILAQEDDNSEQWHKSIQQALVATMSTTFQIINDNIIKESQAKLEGLQLEEKILSSRKSGYRTEVAKLQIEEKIYQNKLEQIDAQYKIDSANTSNQISGTISGIGAGVSAINPIAGLAMQISAPIIGSVLGKADSESRMKAEQAKADLASEKNYKEYNDFWNLFFSTIKNITNIASERVSSLSSDYAKGRNRERLISGIGQQRKMNEEIINSLNDFQGLGTLDEKYKIKTWYGKNKTKHVKTAMNYSFDDMSLEQMKAYANMNPEDLKNTMINEMKKDNSTQSVGDATKGSLTEQVFGGASTAASIVNPIALIGNLLGGSKFKGATWEVLDSDVTDFQESLREAISTIEYLSREMNSLADKIFYANKEGYSSTKQEDVNSKYAELVANAKTAGNTTLAKALQSQWDSEMEKFKIGKNGDGDVGIAEIFYSTFSSIIMDSARKVAKETGKFSDAFATGIGEAFGTQFSNIISEIIDRAVTDNTQVDSYMELFANKLKTYTGDITDYINSEGILDLDGLSKGIGAGSILDSLTSTAKDLTEIQSLNMYKTSQDVSNQLREKGLTETQIAKFLEAASLIDPLKTAVSKLADTFNPVRMSSANISMQRESFDSTNASRLEELRRKKLSGTSTASDIAELQNIEYEDMKLSIKENVVAGFESGIKQAIKGTTYSSVFGEFGSTIGEAISSGILGKLDISKETTEISDLIASGDFSKASMSISELSKRILKLNKENLTIVSQLRTSGLDWTEIESLGLGENIYSEVEKTLESNSSLSKAIAKYQKQGVDYSSTMATEKYTNEEYYNELNKRLSRGEELSKAEREWVEKYSEGLDTIISKQTLINSLESNLQNMLSNNSSLSFLTSVGVSIGDIYKKIIMDGIEANSIMESLTENALGGKSINLQLSQLSTLFQTAKNNQLAIKQQMISQGASYTMIEAIFGEDAASRIANIYGEMKVYSNSLADISSRQEKYKAQLVNVNGVMYTYDEYYREINLKKANGIALTAEEIRYTDEYSKSIKEFETNTAIVNTFYGAVSNAFSKESSQEIFGEFASGFSTILSESIINGYLTNEFADDMATAVALAQQAISTGSVEDLYSAQQQLTAFSTKIEIAKNQSQGLLDMFNSSKLIDFTDKTKDIQYSSSSSKDITYNITQNLTVSAGTVVGDGVTLNKFAQTIAPYVKAAIGKL